MAEYGARILPTLSVKLIPQYADGFSDGAYWRKLKQRLGAKGGGQIVPTLSLEAKAERSHLEILFGSRPFRLYPRNG